MNPATFNFTITCSLLSITQSVMPPCTLPGSGVRTSAGADYLAGGGARSAGEKMSSKQYNYIIIGTNGGCQQIIWQILSKI